VVVALNRATSSRTRNRTSSRAVIVSGRPGSTHDSTALPDMVSSRTITSATPRSFPVLDTYLDRPMAADPNERIMADAYDNAASTTT
jgi:hypothetical protein